MDWPNIILTSFSMAIDASATNAVNAIKEEHISIWKLVLSSFIFAFFQFVMPLIGYLIGSGFRQYIENAIPYIGFSLLLLLSVKCFYDAIKETIQYKRSNGECQIERKKITFLTILAEGVATSIDALCIGFVYLSYQINDALIVFALIGITTFVLSFLSGILGKYIARFLERWANYISGAVFLIIGLKILIESLL